MFNKAVVVGLLVLGLSLAVFAQGGQQVRLMYGDYECSCSYYCPQGGINAGACYDNDNYWAWGRTMTRCCVPSYYEDGYGDLW